MTVIETRTPSNPPTTQNVDERFREMLNILHRGGTYAYWWNLIGLEKRTTWFNVGRPARVINGVENAYFGVHPTVRIPDVRTTADGKLYRPDPSKIRAKIDEIAAVNCLFAEFDRKDGVTAETINALTPTPSVIVDSGGGWHVYWLLRDTWVMSNDDERKRAAETQAAWVAYVGSDDGAKDLARVLRIPGTHNLKYDHRPMVSFTKADLNLLYDLDTLLSYLPQKEARQEVKQLAPATPVSADDRERRYALAAFRNITSDLERVQPGGRNKALFVAACNLFEYANAGYLSHTAVEDALEAAARHVQLPAKEYETTIASAKKQTLGNIKEIPEPKPVDPLPVYLVGDTPYCQRHSTALFKAKDKDLYGCRACLDSGTKEWWKPGDVTVKAPVRSDVDTATGEIIEEPRALTGLPEVVTARSLQQVHFAPLQYVVADILPEGCTLLAGKPKARKSWLALNICEAVALGGRAMSIFQTTPGDALYLDLESSKRRAKRRLEATLRDHEWPENLHYAMDWPKINEGGIEALDMWMEAHPHTKIIVVDVFQDIRPTSDPKRQLYDDDRAAVRPLQQFAARHPGLAVLIVHHTRKAKGDDVFDEISGSTGLTGGVDNIMVLSRSADESNQAVLAVRGRDIEFDDKVSLEWDNDYCLWRAGDGNTVQASTAERQAIINLLADGGTYKTGDIAAALHKSVPNISKQLSNLDREGLVTKAGYGKWRIVTE